MCLSVLTIDIQQEILLFCFIRLTSEFDSIMGLGKGAFGRVFKAKEKLLKKDYAIKIVRCKEYVKIMFSIFNMRFVV